MDASNILKPALARGDFQLIGATTSEEYTKYFEKDAALVRRFQPVRVKEPTVEETNIVLKIIIGSWYQKMWQRQLPLFLIDISVIVFCQIKPLIC